MVWEIDATSDRASIASRSHYDLENFVLMRKLGQDDAGCLIVLGLIALCVGVFGAFGWQGMLVLGVVLILFGYFA